MRWSVFVALALVLAGLGVLAVIEEREDDDEHYAVVRYMEPWRLKGIGADARTLRLGYDGGGCAIGDGRAIVRESRSGVRIQVRQGYRLYAKHPEDTPCPANLIGYDTTARLARPVHGRRIEGSRPIETSGAPVLRERQDGSFAIPIPRVIGLSGKDAVELLGYQYLRPRLRGATVGFVKAQEPAPGTLVRIPARDRIPLVYATVTLTLQRH
jgi:hypothetical protein